MLGTGPVVDHLHPFQDDVLTVGDQNPFAGCIPRSFRARQRDPFNPDVAGMFNLEDVLEGIRQDDPSRPDQRRPVRADPQRRIDPVVAGREEDLPARIGIDRRLDGEDRSVVETSEAKPHAGGKRQEALEYGHRADGVSCGDQEQRESPESGRTSGTRGTRGR